jgi:hypothetical protein
MKKIITIVFLLFATFAHAINFDGTIWEGVGSKTTQATTLTTIKALELGDMAVHRTVLTFTTSPVVMTNNAGVALYGGIGTTTTTAVYTFPKGLIQILGADCRGTLTLTTAGALATFASVSALGQVTASNDATLAGTEANILASTSSSAAVAKAAVVKNISLIAPAAPLDGTVTAIPMFLNFVVANDASNSTGVGTFGGTCTITWSNLSQN